MRLRRTKQHEVKGKLADDILDFHALLDRVIHRSPPQTFGENKH